MGLSLILIKNFTAAGQWIFLSGIFIEAGPNDFAVPADALYAGDRYSSAVNCVKLPHIDAPH